MEYERFYPMDINEYPIPGRPLKSENNVSNQVREGFEKLSLLVI
jgi:hypothetical protein